MKNHTWDVKMITDFKSNSDQVFSWQMYNKYYKFLKNITRRIICNFHNTPLTLDDYEHILYFCVKKSMEAYDLKNPPCNWQQFLVTRLKSEVHCYASKYMTKKHQVINFSTQFNDKSEKVLSEENNSLRPDKVLERKERYEIITNLSLSELERSIVDMRLKELSIGEIAEKLKLKYKTVDNTLQRIATKIKTNHSESCNM